MFTTRDVPSTGVFYLLFVHSYVNPVSQIHQFYLRLGYGVSLGGNVGEWPYGATTAAAIPFFTPQGRRSRHRQVLTFR
jgi:hypothetical protein